MAAIAARMTDSPRASVPGLGVSLDLLRAAVVLLIVLNVSRIHQHFGWLAPTRPALVLAAAAALYAYLNPRLLSTKGLFTTWPPRVILAIAIWACISAPFGLSLGNSGKFILEAYSKVIVGAFLLIAAIRHTRDFYTFVWAYVVGCAILAGMAIFVFELRAAGPGVVRLDDLHTYDANDAGVVLLVGLGLSLLVLQSARVVGKMFALATVVGIGVTLARTGSRGAFVGAVATGTALLLMLRSVPVWKRIGLVGVAAAALALGAPAGYWKQMETILRPTEDYNWTEPEGRKAVTERGVSYMIAYPVFGLGINNFWRAECIDPVSDRVRYRGDRGLRCTAPHNSYIQIGAELGFPGLALWLVLLFGGIVSLGRLRKRLPSGWNRGDGEQRFLYRATQFLPVSFVGFAASSFFVSFAWLDIAYILAAFTAGVLMTAAHRLAVELPHQALVAPAPSRRAARRNGGYRPSVVLSR
jgi:O-antigen ligase